MATTARMLELTKSMATIDLGDIGLLRVEDPMKEVATESRIPTHVVRPDETNSGPSKKKSGAKSTPSPPTHRTTTMPHTRTSRKPQTRSQTRAETPPIVIVSLGPDEPLKNDGGMDSVGVKDSNRETKRDVEDTADEEDDLAQSDSNSASSNSNDIEDRDDDHDDIAQSDFNSPASCSGSNLSDTEDPDEEEDELAQSDSNSSSSFSGGNSNDIEDQYDDEVDLTESYFNSAASCSGSNLKQHRRPR
jgi:hypothetical protein